jgi:hypothetical protein
MDFWTYPTLFSTLRDKLLPELRDLAALHSNAMADMVAQGDPIGHKQVFVFLDPAMLTATTGPLRGGSSSRTSPPRQERSDW